MNRSLRATLGALLALVIAATTFQSASAATPFPDTAKFIFSKFVNGQYIEGFTKGQPDWGFTVEGMLQLKGAGYSNTQLAKAISYNLNSSSRLGTATTRRGFLYAPDGAFLIGRAGQALFAQKVFGLQSTALSKSLLKQVKSNVLKSGEIKNASGNTFTYSWVAMGLQANGEGVIARTVTNKLLTFARADNGFGTDLTADSTASTPDATGIAVLAFATTFNTSGQAHLIARALELSDHNKPYWESWGDVDVNGTAYAAMGLFAMHMGNRWGYISFLRSRIAPDGGLTTPWSNGAGDIFATVQGYLALSGKSYLSLIRK